MTPILMDTVHGWLLHHGEVPGYFWLDYNNTDKHLCIPLAHKNDVVPPITEERETYLVVPKDTLLIDVQEGVKRLASTVSDPIRKLTEAEALELSRTYQVYYCPLVAILHRQARGWRKTLL